MIEDRTSKSKKCLVEWVQVANVFFAIFWGGILPLQIQQYSIRD